jgi:hypothetical protein
MQCSLNRYPRVTTYTSSSKHIYQVLFCHDVHNWYEENRNDPDLVQAFLMKGGLNQILRRQSSRSHYGSKVPAIFLVNRCNVVLTGTLESPHIRPVVNIFTRFYFVTMSITGMSMIFWGVSTFNKKTDLKSRINHYKHVVCTPFIDSDLLYECTLYCRLTVV